MTDPDDFHGVVSHEHRGRTVIFFARALESFGDSRHDFAGIFVLPRAQYGPAGSLQSQCLIRVPPLVLLDLRLPVAAVRRWHRPVLGTSVPIAAVDVYDDPLARKHDVGPKGSAALNVDRKVDAEAKTARVQEGTNSPLRPCVRAPVRSHDASPNLRHSLPRLSRSTRHRTAVKHRRRPMRAAAPAILIT